MRVQVPARLDLDQKQLSLLELHSVYNVLSVLFGELDLLENVLKLPGVFAEQKQICQRVKQSFENPEAVRDTLVELPALCSQLEQDVRRTIANNPPEESHFSYVVESLENFGRVLSIAGVRIRELLVRQAVEEQWKYFSTAQLTKELQEVFAVMAGNPNGKFAVVFPPDQLEAGKYLIDIQICGPDERVFIPESLTDVLRDLTANARKYSSPGTEITTCLTQHPDHLKLSISDQGRGIPEEELSRVHDFGYRASNALGKVTMGGGFGLTKAAWITNQFHGEMWIESVMGQGTTITITIPLPG